MGYNKGSDFCEKCGKKITSGTIAMVGGSICLECIEEEELERIKKGGINGGTSKISSKY
jgi:hypothetical protein